MGWKWHFQVPSSTGVLAHAVFLFHLKHTQDPALWSYLDHAYFIASPLWSPRL